MDALDNFSPFWSLVSAVDVTNIFHDSISFLLLHILIFSLFLYAVARSHYVSYRNKQGGATFKIRRGQKSFEVFVYTGSFVVTALLAVIFSISEAGKGYKVFLFIVDSIIVFYLSLWNNWSRNKIVGLYSRVENKIEE